jgi:hypothetical protein
MHKRRPLNNEYLIISDVWFSWLMMSLTSGAIPAAFRGSAALDWSQAENAISRDFRHGIEERSVQTITTIGFDIAKSVFQVHGVDAAGEVVIRRQLKRRYVLAFFRKLPPRLKLA